MTIPITITEAALIHLLGMFRKNPNALGFRLSVKKTGCSGFAYQPAIIETINADDLHFVIQDLPIYLDQKYLDLINGLTIDYVEDNALGLKQKRLKFINPNEKNRCGCGESFTV